MHEIRHYHVCVEFIKLYIFICGWQLTNRPNWLGGRYLVLNWCNERRLIPFSKLQNFLKIGHVITLLPFICDISLPELAVYYLSFPTLVHISSYVK